MIKINDVSELPKVPTADEQKNVYKIEVDKYNNTSFVWQPYPQDKGFKELGRWIVSRHVRDGQGYGFSGYCFASKDKFPKYLNDGTHDIELNARAIVYRDSGYDNAIADMKARWDYFDVLGAYSNVLYVDTNDGNVYCTDSADNWQWPYDLEKYIDAEAPNNGGNNGDKGDVSPKDTKTSLDK